MNSTTIRTIFATGDVDNGTNCVTQHKVCEQKHSNENTQEKIKQHDDVSQISYENSYYHKTKLFSTK